MSNRSKDDQISPISEIDPEVKSYSKDLTKRLARARQGAAAGQASPTNDFLDRLADRLSRVNAQAAAWQANLRTAMITLQCTTNADAGRRCVDQDREVSASDFALPRIVYPRPSQGPCNGHRQHPPRRRHRRRRRPTAPRAISPLVAGPLLLRAALAM